MCTPAVLDHIDIEFGKVFVHGFAQAVKQLLDLGADQRWRWQILRPVFGTYVCVFRRRLQASTQLFLDIVHEVFGRIRVVEQVFAHDHVFWCVGLTTIQKGLCERLCRSQNTAFRAGIDGTMV